MIKCKDCKKSFIYRSQLLQHYLKLLPYYFGHFLCTSCELKFDGEIKLIKHCFSKKHKRKQTKTHNSLETKIKEKRIKYFDNESNHLFGLNNTKFTPEEIKELIEGHYNSSSEINSTIIKMEDNLYNHDNSDMLYEAINSPSQEVSISEIQPTTCTYTESRLQSSERSFSVPSPPQFAGTPLQDEFHNTSQCCCDKVDKLHQQLQTNFQNLEMAINRSTTRVLEALSQSLRYQQQLCQTFGENPNNQKVEQFVIEMSDIAKKIWRK